MTVDQFGKLREIYQAAMEREPAERETYLEEACGDDERLLDQVRAMVKDSADASDLFDQPVWKDMMGEDEDEEPEPIADLDVEPGLPFERLGEYRLIRQLGTGGMGTVYMALQESLKRMVALKVIRVDRMGSIEVSRRFKREVETISQLQHPNIVTVFGSGVEKGVRYFAMDLIPGEDLDEELRKARQKGEKVPVTRILRWIMAIARALDSAHGADVIHRDVKPSNIRITPEGRPMLMDFGVARHMNLSKLTLTGEFRGTPHYASPEQVDVKDKGIDERTDIYSLGVTLYEAVTGEVPFNGETREQVFKQILEKEPLAPRRYNPDLSRDVETVILKAMSKERGRRYANMAEFADDLERLLDGEMIRARPTTWITRLGMKIKRNVELTALGFVTVVAIIVAFTKLGEDTWIIAIVGGPSVVFAAAYYIFRVTKERNKAIAARLEANEKARIAEEQLEEITRLSEVKTLADLMTSAEKLWPAEPDKVPAMEKWIHDAENLRESYVTHRDRLKQLRFKALPYDTAELAKDRESHPQQAVLNEIKTVAETVETRLAELGAVSEQESLPSLPQDPNAPIDDALAEFETRRKQSGALQRLIETKEKEISKRRVWKFEDVELQWQHDTLQYLVEGIAALSDKETGLLRKITERLNFARSVRAVSLEMYAEAWDEAIASIATLPRYGGLRIEPQVGFVPIGRDPNSGLWEFAHLQTGDVVQRGADGRLDYEVNHGLVFVLIPGGTFAMGAAQPGNGRELGAPNVDPLAEAHEEPIHTVTIEPFLLAKFQVTQAQWLRFTGENPSAYGQGTNFGRKLHKPMNPVEQVSWDDCQSFLSKLKLRLPAEAEWEYSARGDTATIWWTGNDRDSLKGAVNVADKYLKENGGPPGWPYEMDFNDGYSAHAPVNDPHFRPNPFGLHHVTGNVFEWCHDRYHDTYQGAPTDGSAWDERGSVWEFWINHWDEWESIFESWAEVWKPWDPAWESWISPYRIFRGGSMNYFTPHCRSGFRSKDTPRVRHYYLGVRPACFLEGYRYEGGEQHE